MSRSVGIKVAKPNRTDGVKAPARGREMQRFMKKAAKGDESCLPQVRALLSDPERGVFMTDYCGSSAVSVRRTIAIKASGGNLLAREAIEKKLDMVRRELEGPNPTPIERLLAERASICWFVVNW